MIEGFMRKLFDKTCVTKIPKIENANIISNALPKPASLRLVIDIR